MKLHTRYGATSTYSQKPEGSSKKVLVVAGFGESTYHIKPLVNALADKGYEAISYRPPRRSGKEAGTRTDPIMRQARIILDVLGATLPKGEKVHAVAHSLGSAAVLKAAQLEPNLFSSLTLMQPVGMFEEPMSVTNLAKRAMKKIANNQRIAKLGNGAQPNRVALTRFASGAVIARNPLLAWREAVAAGNYTIVDDLQQVAELGIPVHIAVSKGDEMFDHAEVQRRRGSVEGLVQSYTLLEEATSNHDTFWIHPDNTAELLESLI